MQPRYHAYPSRPRSSAIVRPTTNDDANATETSRQRCPLKPVEQRSTRMMIEETYSQEISQGSRPKKIMRSHTHQIATDHYRNDPGQSNEPSSSTHQKTVPKRALTRTARCALYDSASGLVGSRLLGKGARYAPPFHPPVPRAPSQLSTTKSAQPADSVGEDVYPLGTLPA
jgi:hypothetical protein